MFSLQLSFKSYATRSTFRKHKALTLLTSLHGVRSMEFHTSETPLRTQQKATMTSTIEEPWFKHRSTSTLEYWRSEQFPEDRDRILNTSAVYEQFTLNGNQLRLIRLLPSAVYHAPVHCEFIVHDLDTPPEYSALSYRWSDIHWTQIKVNGFWFDVTLRVSAALRRLRLRDDPVLIWVDAICINQQNTQEKSQQVQSMGRIYEKAEEVFIWLGDGPDDECSSGLSVFYEFAQAASCLHSESLPCHDCTVKVAAHLSDYFPTSDAWEAFGIIFLDEWWNRTWVVQELLFAKHAWILCGPASIRWEVFERAMAFLTEIRRGHLQLEYSKHLCSSERDVGSNPNKSPPIASTSIIHSGESEAGSDSKNGPESLLRNRIKRIIDYDYNPWLTLARRCFQLGDGFELLQLLIDTWRREATDPRDKVFAISHLVKDEKPYSMRTDYSKSISIVYGEVVQYLIAQYRNLDILLYAHINQESRIPSWCPNWCLQNFERRESQEGWFQRVILFKRQLEFGKQAQSKYAASGSSTPTARFSEGLDVLTLRGAKIDEVAVAESNELFACKDPLKWTFGLWSEIGSSGIIEDPETQYPYGGTLWEAWRRVKMIPPRNTEDTRVRAELLDQSVDDLTSGLNAFVTKSGLMGSVYGAVKPGDLICIFYGGKTPFVLRPHQHPSNRSTEFQFIGSCYGKCLYSQPSPRRYTQTKQKPT
jgi:hypothetical protein